jgi:hypothetical protein
MEKNLLKLLEQIVENQEKLFEELTKLRKKTGERNLYDEGMYRELVKKILDVENELNRKFRALGEEVVDLKEKITKLGKKKRKKV